MKRKRNGGKPVFCESKNVPKIQTVEVDLYKKKDLKKFLESKEFKESKIDEELIVEYISSMKESSPAKKMLLLNSKLFEKYIQTHSINTKADLDELFQTRETQKSRIPNLFNKTEREDWYNTESFKKCGVSKEEIEKLIQEEEFNVESNVKSINLTKEYSKTKDLEKQYGTLKEDLSFNEPTVSKIARIATVTKTKSVDKVIEELKAKGKDSSKSKNEITTVQPKIYIPAQIKADGRLNRKILGTVTGKEFVAERNNLMNIPQSFVTEKIANPTSISDMVRQQIAEQLKETSFTCEEKVDSTQSKFVHNEQINIGKTQSSQPVSQEVIQGQTQTEPVEYSVGSKNPKVYKKTEQTPEEIKMAKINANYEHDKAVLAKEDPMFAKNQFWDVGHAEGSGEISNRELEKLATLQSEELLEQIKGRDL